MNIVSSTELKTRGAILTAVLIINTICQMYIEQLESMQYIGWLFFLSNVMYYTMEGTPVRRFIMAVAGSVSGLASAALFVRIELALAAWGLPHVAAVILPLILILGYTIMLHPVCPYVFNNCAFAYFIVALIDPASAYQNLLPNIIWAITGTVLVNGLCILFVKITTKKELEPASK